MMQALVNDVAAYIGTLQGMESASVSASMLVELSAPDLAVLHVVVQPIQLTVTSASRQSGVSECRLGIYISRHASTNAEAVAVLDAVELVASSLVSHNQSHETFSYACTEVAVEPNPDDALNQTNVMKATLEATFKMVRR